MNAENRAYDVFCGLMKNCFFYDSNAIAYVAKSIGRSQQTIRQYKAAPGSKSHRTPTMEVIEAIRGLVMHRDVQVRNVVFTGAGGGYKVNGMPEAIAFRDYLIALDFADSRGGVVSTDEEIPTLDDGARLRHQWRQVAFGKIIPVDMLADIAGVDVYTVGWVGREHPTEGIQPSSGMVAAAMAAEALTELRGAAA